MVNLMSKKHRAPNLVAHVSLGQQLESAAPSWLLGKPVSSRAAKVISRIPGENRAPESWRRFMKANKMNK